MLVTKLHYNFDINFFLNLPKEETSLQIPY